MSITLQILIIWIVTLITSVSMDLMLYFRIFKDIADAGYKFDDKKIQDANQQYDPKAKKYIKSSSRLEKMIPIYNLFKSCETIIEYIKSRDTILNYFYVMDALEEMTKLEKEEYAKKPTGFNSLLVPIKVKMRLLKATTIEINSEEGKSKIIYEQSETGDDINILEVSGPLSKLSEKEQKLKIIETIEKSLKKEIDEFEASLKKEIDEFEASKKGVSEQKQDLQNLKDELLCEDENEKKLQSDNSNLVKKLK